MDDRSSLDRLRGDLLRHRLPDDYIERVIGELADHQADLVREGEARGLDAINALQTADARLGKPHKVVKDFVREYRRRTFRARHPIASFAGGSLGLIVAPMFLTLAGWLLSIEWVFGLFAVKSRYWFIEHDLFTPYVWLSRTIGMLAFLGPPALATLLACRLIRRSRRSRAWLLASCATLALLMGVLRPVAHFSREIGKSRIDLLPFWTDSAVWAHVPPMLLPAAIAFTVARRNDPRRKNSTA